MCEYYEEIWESYKKVEPFIYVEPEWDDVSTVAGAIYSDLWSKMVFANYSDIYNFCYERMMGF